MKQTFLKHGILFAFLMATVVGFAQNKFTIEKEAGLSGINEIRFSVYNHPVDVQISNNNKIELITHVAVSKTNNEDIAELKKALEGISFSKNDDAFNIATSFYKTMKGVNGQHTITLNTGKKIKVRDLKISYILTIPNDRSLKFSSKYGDVSIPDYEGEIHANYYDCNVTMGNLSNEANISMKYSDFNLGTTTHLSLNLYDSKVKIGNCSTLNISSKYSKIELNNVDDFRFNSYDDKTEGKSMGKTNIVAKYSEFTFDSTKDIKLDVYDSNFESDKVSNITLKSKYSKFKIGGATSLKAHDTYDDDFIFETIGNVNIKVAKYCSFIIDNGTGSFNYKGYNSKINISNLDCNSETVTIVGKYDKVDIGLSNSCIYGLEVDVKYPKIEYNKTKFYTEIEEKSGSQLTMKAIPKESTDDCYNKIIINGYDMTVTLK